MSQTETKHPLINFIQGVEEAVGQCRFHCYSTFQEKRSHHWYISNRQKKCSNDTEHQCLGHRRKVFSFNAGQRQDREEYNQNDKYGKCSTSHYMSGTFFHFTIHFLTTQGTSSQSPSVQVSQNTFQNNNGAIHYNTKIDGTQTHQIGRHIKDTHQDKSKKHSQRND
ncbi:unknown [Bacteroides sp. CAG:1076]|nr:unknown [Bacteroides sp. CAG:1076]